MKTRKSISYAYWSSPAAVRLGHGKTGCFYIATQTLRADGTWSPPTAAHNAEGFQSPDAPDLILSFIETEGEVCPLFLSHGNAQALAALRSLPVAL